MALPAAFEAVYGPGAAVFAGALVGGAALAAWLGRKREGHFSAWALASLATLALATQSGFLVALHVAVSFHVDDLPALLRPTLALLALAFALGVVAAVRIARASRPIRGRALAACAILIPPCWSWMLWTFFGAPELPIVFSYGVALARSETAAPIEPPIGWSEGEQLVPPSPEHGAVVWRPVVHLNASGSAHGWSLTEWLPLADLSKTEDAPFVLSVDASAPAAVIRAFEVLGGQTVPVLVATRPEPLPFVDARIFVSGRAPPLRAIPARLEVGAAQEDATLLVVLHADGTFAVDGERVDALTGRLARIPIERLARVRVVVAPEVRWSALVAALDALVLAGADEPTIALAGA